MRRISSTHYEQFVQSAQAEMSVAPEIAWAVGLAGETGEVMEIIKKGCLRVPGDIGYVEVDRAKLVLELGDVLFYLTSLGLEYGITTDEVRAGNMAKLEGRGRG